MIIGARSLKIKDGNSTIDVPIKIHAPEQNKGDWICRFEIDWPDKKIEQWGTGGDGIDAILRALQMIGALLYSSGHHEQRRLYWLEPGAGFGFPVTNNLRDIL